MMNNSARPARPRRESYRHGIYAEIWAALYLWFKGYRLRARRYKTSGGEIDLIATRGRNLVFIEVKYRPDLTQAISAIPPAAYRRLRAAGATYLAHHPQFAQYQARFDLIAVGRFGQIRHLDNIDLSSA